MQTTHVQDPVTGLWRQIVSPSELRAVLDADGDDYDRPSWMGPGDEWETDGDEV